MTHLPAGRRRNHRQSNTTSRWSSWCVTLTAQRQDKLHSALSGNLGGRGIALIALAATALWGFSGVFRVEPDELGVETCSSPQHGPRHQPTMPTTEVAIYSK